MRKPLRFDAEAEDELDSAHAWYERHVRGLGDDLLDVIDQLLQRVHDRPGAFPPAPEVPRVLGVRRAVVPNFPFVVAFIDLENEIRVLALAHTRRRPGYWRRRARRPRPH